MNNRGIIIYISHYSDFLGANRSLFQIVTRISKYGYEPLVLVPKEGIFTNKLREKGVKFNVINMFTPYYIKSNMVKNLYHIVRGFYMEFRNILTAYRISNKLKGKHIICVHTNSSVTNIGAYISRFIDVSHFWHVREFAHLHYGYIQPWGNKNQRKFMGKYSSQIILVSESLRKYYSSDVENNKLHVIYNGLEIPLSPFDLKTYETINIVTVGLIHPSKKQLDILMAFNESLSRINNKQIHLYIVGSYGDSIEYYEELKCFVKTSGLEGKVTFTGYCNDVASLLKTMHIGILASSYEAFGRVTVEYMLNNLVPIVSNSGANSEIINDLNTGYIFQTLSELTDILVDIINNPEKMEEISKNARNYAMSNFSIERTIDSIIKCYQSVHKI